MAKLQPIPELFIASDYLLRFTIFNADETQCVDVSGFALSWMLKKSLGQQDSAALVEKHVAAGVTVSGAFNANPALNAQRVLVALTAADTVNLKPRIAAHELKRMDASVETPLSYGPATLVRGVHRT